MDSEWCIIRSKHGPAARPYAIVHGVNRVLHGFETREDAERVAIERARAAYADGDETAHVTEYLDGQHRTIWRAGEAPAARARRKRSALKPP